MKESAQIIALTIFILLNTSSVIAQFQQDNYRHRERVPARDNELYLAIRAAGFFNNNEFFDTHAEGYTLTGNYFQPVIYYYFRPEFSLSGGIHLLKYHGQEGFADLLPWLSVSYEPTKNLRISLGSYNKGAALNLPEPLFKFENQFTTLQGNGIMINYSGNRWNSVTWLDWISFIEPGDPFREEFVFGHSSSLSLFKNETHQLKIPYYIIAGHKGGQINITDEPVETRMDLGGGVEWTKQADLGIFNRIMLKADIYHEEAALDAVNGNALYGYGELKGELFSFGLGYFYEKNWESILGQPLLFSPGTPDSNGNESRQFILFKAGLGKKTGDNSSLNIRFEGYYDTVIQKMQYTYGLHIIVDEWIGIFSRADKTSRAY